MHLQTVFLVTELSFSAQNMIFCMYDHKKCPSSEKEHEKYILRKSYFHGIQPKHTVVLTLLLHAAGTGRRCWPGRSSSSSSRSGTRRQRQTPASRSPYPVRCILELLYFNLRFFEDFEFSTAGCRQCKRMVNLNKIGNCLKIEFLFEYLPCANIFFPH